MRSFIFFIAILWAFNNCKSKSEGSSITLSRPLEHEVPLFFGLNNNFPKTDSMLVIIKDPLQKVVLKNKGYHPVWGLSGKTKLKLSGRYNYYVKFFSDSNHVSEFSNYFDMEGDEERIDFSVNVSPYLPGGAEVYVNKYYGNKYNVAFIRKWDPQKNNPGNDLITPEYELKNNGDSTVYGIYRVQSSTFATHWARLHYSTFTQLQKWEDSVWVPLPVNTCVIAAKIERGKTGEVYPDLKYPVSKKGIKTPGKFRIELEYGINDAIRRMPDTLLKIYPNLYYEVHIYRCFDEFELK